LEVFTRDRVLPLLAEVSLRDENVDINRIGVVLDLEERDRARVLLAAEDQLELLLAHRLLAPSGQRGAHPDGRDGHRDEQHDQDVPAIVQPWVSARAGHALTGDLHDRTIAR
jgi:hypothetical protein